MAVFIFCNLYILIVEVVLRPIFKDELTYSKCGTAENKHRAHPAVNLLCIYELDDPNKVYMTKIGAGDVA